MQDRLWDQIRGELQTYLPQHIFHSLVECAKLESTDDSELNLSFPDNFSKDGFKEKCEPVLRNVLKKLQLESLQILLTVTERTHPQRQPSHYHTPELLGRTFFDAKYTFDAFVVGGSNQFAHAACQAVAKQPGQCYNPLFIFGGAGLGKTHLIKAIGYEVTLMKRDLKVMYLTSEAFTNELIHAIRLDRMREFREKFRSSCDVLLLDDVHFFAGKERTQEEFFYTFNYLHELRKQIVITSDRYPKDIQGLEDRLQTRFEWGLVADVQPPEMETRVAILKNKAESSHIELPTPVAEYMASNVKNNIRELEGALHRLQAYASLTGAPISLELAKQIFKDIAPKYKHELTPDAILKLVALHFNVRTTDLKSAQRARKHSFPRQVCMYLLRKYLLMSFPEIGRFMGGKDHTTVLHGVTKIADKLRSDTQTLHDVSSIESLIR